MMASKYSIEQIEVLEYLASDLSGMSAQCIAACVIGLDTGNKNHPYDPSDFGRCARLADRFPYVKDNLHLLKSVSGAWARIIENWDDIYSLMESEVGIDWSKGRTAPKTYKLMKSVLREDAH